MTADLSEPNESLLLRPGWFLMTTWFLGSILFIVIGAIGWAYALGSANISDGTIVAWVVAVGGTLMVVILLGFILRSRLILTPEGFRVRWLWGGRLVPWTKVTRFYADDAVGGPAAPTRGVCYVPRDDVDLDAGMARQIWAAWHREIPTFGRSRDYMLETLQAWLTRYSGAEMPTSDSMISASLPKGLIGRG